MVGSFIPPSLYPNNIGMYDIVFVYLPLNSCRMACTLWTLWSFSAPAAPAQTPLFPAREPLWHAKTPLLPHGSHFGAQNGPSHLPVCCLSARKGHSGLLRRRRCAQNGRSGLPRCRQCARKGCSGPLQRCQCAQNSCSGPLWCRHAPKIAVLACSGAASAL